MRQKLTRGKALPQSERKRIRRSYDGACLTLAKIFVLDCLAGDLRGLNAEELSDELAQRIQDTIEDFLQEHGL